MDWAHEWTDEQIAELTERVRAEYAQAVADVQNKLDDYLRRFKKKDEAWRRMVASGKKTEAEYKQWRMGQIAVGRRWEAMRDQLAEDLHNYNMIARSIIDGYMPEVYAVNHNFATWQIEHMGRVDTGYTLYNREAVERLLRDVPDLLPPIGPRMAARIAAGKDIAWQSGQIQSVMTQAILQGESIPHIAQRIAETLGETNHASTIRYARTAITSAQNAGRQDAFELAEAKGVNLKKEWIATLDGRTRHAHRQLDGQVRPVDKPFEVDGYDIMYPGDPTAEAYLVYNCRCTMQAKVSGWTDVVGALRSNAALGGQSYEEWKEGHSVSHPITKQEEIAETMRQSYINELYRGR